MSGVIGQDLQVQSGKFGFPTGHVLQVKQVKKTGPQSMSASGSVNWTAVTGMEATITPSAITSKILITTALVVGSSTYAVFAKLQAKTEGGSYSDLGALGDASDSRTRIMMSALGGGSGDNSEMSTMTMMYLDSPLTLLKRYYQPWYSSRHTGTAQINNNDNNTNHDYHGRSISTITLMEIAGEL